MVSAGMVRAAGLDVAYDRAGSGPPLVLVHGAAGDAREWRSQIAGLSDDFTVIAWDEPGAGRSSDVPPDFGLGGYATALAALVETLGAPAHVCGLSWGGTVTLELYRRRPELVRALPLSVARDFARAIPHAELVVIPGAGHMSNLERPDEFNAAVRDFCRRGP